MKVIVRNARLSFHDLFEAKSIKGGKPRFNATLICSDETLLKVTGTDGEVKAGLPHSKMEAVCQIVAKDKFGTIPAKLKNWAYNKADGSTTRDVYTNSEGDFWAGFDEETWYITAVKREDKAQNGAIKVLDQAKQAIPANSGRIYSGCYVNAIIDVYAYQDEDGIKGVSASLEGVQLLSDGEALGFSQVDAEEEFDMEEVPEGSDSDDLL